MNISHAFAVLPLLFTTALLSQDATESRPISVTELNQRSVVGRLGIPLGTASEIEAEIISGEALRQKRYAGRYLLKVTKVGDKTLETPVPMEFYVPGFISVQLASDVHELYELKNGDEPRIIDTAMLPELEKDYVGRNVNLCVYESGGFSGIPENKPADVPIWQGTAFHFSTHLTVLAERNK